jgi:23S rRNA maturation-related 3'-5' exoribonuclease YhaM
MENVMLMSDEKIREKIVDELFYVCETGKEKKNMEKLIQWMTENGYFESACSSGNHLAVYGGLARHSLNVYMYANELAKAWDAYGKLTRKDLTLATLLHDLGKAGDHGNPGYVPNILKSGGISKAKPYERNKLLMPIPHEQRSVIIAERFIELSQDVEWAIAAHAGLYGEYKYIIQGNETPLYLILSSADMWSSRVVEEQ